MIIYFVTIVKTAVTAPSLAARKQNSAKHRAKRKNSNLP
jgi:hypothetical protein